MKISSASKKVLASALSAAMVVAFAPAAAMAKTIDAPDGIALTANTVAVTYDLNGGSIASGSAYTSLASENAAVYTNATTGKSYIKVDTSKGSAVEVNSSIAKKLGVNATEWFVDADNDGELDDNEYGVDGTNGYLEIENGTTAVTLKAYYNTPKVTTADADIFAVNGDATLGDTIAATGLTNGTFYTATLTDPAGKVIAQSDPVKAAKDSVGVVQYSNDTFKKSSAWDSNYKLAKGDYVLKVADTTGATAISKTFTVVELTLAAGTYGSFASDATTSILLSKGASLTEAQLGDSTGSINRPSTDNGYTVTGWEADGSVVTKDTKFTKDTTLTAVYSNPQVSGAQFDATTYAADGKGKITFTASNLPTLTNGHYEFTVAGPNGFSKTVSKTADGSGNIAVSNGTASVALTFGSDYESYAQVTNKLEAGTYTANVSVVADENKTLTTAEKQVSVAAKSASLAAVSYDLGTGSWADTAAAKNAQKAQKTLAVVGTSLKSIKDTLTAGLTDDNVKAADSLQAIDYITVDGVKTAKLDKETVAEGGVKVAVAYKESKATLPQVAFAASGNGYVATVTPAAGTTVRANGNVLGSDGKVTLAANGTLAITVTAGTKSNSVTYYGCSEATNAGNPLNTVGTFATGIANGTTSVSVANKPVRYGDTFKTLKADAEAAIKAIGFATSEDWAKTVTAQKKALIEKAVEVENANIDAAQALVKGVDGKYTYVTESDAAKAKAAAAKVVADFEGLTGKDAAKYTATSKYDASNLVTASSTGAQYAAAVKIAAAVSKTEVAAADAEAVIAAQGVIAKVPAAADVTAANAVEAKAAAQAALEAYGKLTTAQKKLVNSETVDNAYKVAAAADEAIETADKAAVAKAKGKTVKAKAKKKTTAKLTVVTSETGAKSTFKKTSGNAKITVAKGGKITVKKGLKAGKTYTAKVKATVGTQTKTVKVTVKVSK